jgi:Rrf2 family protein
MDSCKQVSAGQGWVAESPGWEGKQCAGRGSHFPRLTECNRGDYVFADMAANCRFAFAVHMLTVLACQREQGVSSDVLAASVNTNAVVIRRILSTLRAHGLVATCRGPRGGARLSRAPEAITLDEIYRAVGSDPIFSLHPQHPNRRCPVGRKIERVLDEVFTAAQSALEAELAKRTLADVADAPEGRARPAAATS